MLLIGLGAPWAGAFAFMFRLAVLPNKYGHTIPIRVAPNLFKIQMIASLMLIGIGAVILGVWLLNRSDRSRREAAETRRRAAQAELLRDA